MKYLVNKYISVSILVLPLLLGLQPEALACTLWAAAGSRVAGGGVLVAKNRDMPPDHRQELRLVRPPEGFRYLGLIAVDCEEPGSRQWHRDESFWAKARTPGTSLSLFSQEMGWPPLKGVYTEGKH